VKIFFLPLCILLSIAITAQGYGQDQMISKFKMLLNDFVQSGNLDYASAAWATISKEPAKLDNNTALEMRLEIIKAISAKINPNVNLDKPPALNVGLSDRPDIEPGVDPGSIKNQDDRKRYEAAIAANEELKRQFALNALLVTCKENTEDFIKREFSGEARKAADSAFSTAIKGNDDTKQANP
jgi:hypothetical protein